MVEKPRSRRDNDAPHKLLPDARYKACFYWGERWSKVKNNDVMARPEPGHYPPPLTSIATPVTLQYRIFIFGTSEW